MLVKIKKLIYRSERMLAACDAALAKLRSEENALRTQEEELREKLSFLNQLMQMAEINTQHVTRSDIYGVLRKIAVIEQNLALTRMQISELQTRKQDNIREQERQKQKKVFWWMRQRKYVYLKKKIIQLRNRKEWQIDEVEQEEVCNGKSKRF